MIPTENIIYFPHGWTGIYDSFYLCNHCLSLVNRKRKHKREQRMGSRFQVQDTFPLDFLLNLTLFSFGTWLFAWCSRVMEGKHHWNNIVLFSHVIQMNQLGFTIQSKQVLQKDLEQLFCLFMFCLYIMFEGNPWDFKMKWILLFLFYFTLHLLLQE